MTDPDQRTLLEIQLFNNVPEFPDNNVPEFHKDVPEFQNVPDDFIGVRVGGVIQLLDTKKELDHLKNDPVRYFEWLLLSLPEAC